MYMSVATTTIFSYITQPTTAAIALEALSDRTTGAAESRLLLALDRPLKG